MTLRFGLHSAQELYGKLRRDAAALEAEVTSDGTFNFVITAYHPAEWATKDKSDGVDGAALEAFKRSKWYQACRDLANAAKHFELDERRNPNPTKEATSETGYGVGRYGKGPYGQGEERILLRLNSDEVVSLLELVSKVMALYIAVFPKQAQSESLAQ